MSTRGAGGGVWARLAAIEHELRTLRLRVTSEAGGGVPAAPHATEHYDGGDDEVDVTQLGGYPGGSPKTYLDSDGAFTDPSSSNPHASTHYDGGADEVDVTQLGGFPGGSPLTYLDSDGNFSTPSGGGGGGSGDISSGAYASRPSAGNAGALYVPTDAAVTLFRDDGALWRPIINGYQGAEPIDGDFAWINQDAATVTAAKGVIYLHSGNGTGGSHELNIRKKAAPSTPYTITAVFMTSMPLFTNVFIIGLLWRQSSDGKLVVFEYNGSSGSGVVLAVQKYNSPTSFNSGYTVDGGAIGPRHPIYLRIADNGTNRICSFSADGLNWRAVSTESRTDFMTADEVGFSVDILGSTSGNLTLASWMQE